MNTKISSRQPVYLRIKQSIADSLSALPPGGRIASENELALEFKTARLTARKALVQLAREGLIITLPGKGSFVPGGQAAKKQICAVFVHFMKDLARQGGYLGRIISGITGNLSAIEWRFIEAAQAESYLQNSTARGIIIISPNLHDNESLFFSVYRRKIPMVLINHNGAPYGIPSVCCSSTAALKKTAELMKKNRARQASFLGYSADFQDVKQRLADFSSACHNLQINLAEKNIFYPGADISILRSFLANSLLGKNPVDCLISGSSCITSGVLAFCREKKIRIPEDMAFAAFDDEDYYSLITPAVTVIDQPLEQIGKEAMRMLSEIMTGKKPEETNITLPAKIIIRKSLGFSKNKIKPKEFS